jgi:hypothetical protein
MIFPKQLNTKQYGVRYRYLSDLRNWIQLLPHFPKNSLKLKNKFYYERVRERQKGTWTSTVLPDGQGGGG